MSQPKAKKRKISDEPILIARSSTSQHIPLSKNLIIGQKVTVPIPKIQFQATNNFNFGNYFFLFNLKPKF